MKKIILFFTAVCILTACNHVASEHATENISSGRLPGGGNYSKPISIDTANMMIGSYLDGINYTVNTHEIRSLGFDADVLRAYLNDTSHGVIKNVKFMFAHSLDYIHSGHKGQRPDTNSNALTMIIVGVDKDGNYVYTSGNMALDYAMPCPTDCFGGQASSNFLVKAQ